MLSIASTLVESNFALVEISGNMEMHDSDFCPGGKQGKLRNQPFALVNTRAESEGGPIRICPGICPGEYQGEFCFYPGIHQGKSKLTRGEAGVLPGQKAVLMQFPVQQLPYSHTGQNQGGYQSETSGEQMIWQFGIKDLPNDLYLSRGHIAPDCM